MTVNIQRTLTPFTDLDDVFELRVAGDPTAAATGIQATGTTTDLNQRYAPLSIGSAIATNTGIQRIGTTTDLRDIFAAKGSAVSVDDPWNGSTYISVGEDNSAGPGTTAIATFEISLNTSGTFTITQTAQGDTVSSTSGTPTSGTWLTAGSASNVQVQFVYTPSLTVGTPIVTNGASSYTTISSNRSILIRCTAAVASTQVISEGSLTINLRRVSGGAILDTSSLSVQCSASNNA